MVIFVQASAGDIVLVSTTFYLLHTISVFSFRAAFCIFGLTYKGEVSSIIEK
jgi:hypothetical protein